jgi:hypothetical protein
LNRESERIIKKAAFLTVEDSSQLAAGIFNPSADNMQQRSGGIKAGSARHAGILQKPNQQIKH